jgi:hypothetical protein
VWIESQRLSTQGMLVPVTRAAGDRPPR